MEKKSVLFVHQTEPKDCYRINNGAIVSPGYNRNDYVLKSQVVPPVCPTCPATTCANCNNNPEDENNNDSTDENK